MRSCVLSVYILHMPFTFACCSSHLDNLVHTLPMFLSGSMKDPDNLPGLAHFCEHMLFLGTEKVKLIFVQHLKICSICGLVHRFVFHKPLSMCGILKKLLCEFSGKYITKD